MDSDDVLHSKAIEVLIKETKISNDSFCFCGLEKVFSYDKIDIFSLINAQFNSLSIQTKSDVIRIHGYPVASIYRMDIIKKYHLHFNQNCKYMENNVFNSLYFMNISSFRYVNDNLYFYMQLSGSLTHPKNKLEIIKKREWHMRYFSRIYEL